MRFRNIVILFLLLSLLLLNGCADKTLELSGGKVPLTAEELVMVVTPEDLDQLDALTGLKSADFSGSACYEELLSWAQAHPDVDMRYTVDFPDGTQVDNRAEKLDLSSLSARQKEEAAPLLRYLPALRSVTLSGKETVSPELLAKVTEVRPDVDYRFTLPLLKGTVDSGIKKLSFIGHGRWDVMALEEVLPYLKALRAVDLGTEESSPLLTWKEIAALQSLRPDVEFSYGFSLYDREFTTLDETMDFSHVKLRDEGEALWRVLPCMQRLKMLDMDSCGIDNETMAAIRDQYPEVNVVWRVWFGDIYSERTDAIKILASNPGVGGNLRPGTYENLKYFTKLKYIDVGHQPLMDDISFVSYMPDLEVAILAMGCWEDCTPLASCPHLEFLEIQTTKVKDITPLAGLKELRHLNLGHLFELTDITPIYGLDLERLWIGMMTPVPTEQVEEYQRLHPNCVIETEAYDPHHMWRWIGIDDAGNPIRHPRYDLLVKQFGYDSGGYSFEWLEDRGW